MAKKQINVRFDGGTLEQIEELSELTGKTVSEILRESVNLTNWLYRERDKGTRILLERPDSDLREVVLPR